MFLAFIESQMLVHRCMTRGKKCLLQRDCLLNFIEVFFWVLKTWGAWAKSS